DYYCAIWHNSAWVF
nr:immunoglobulin light chain junction region [Macaca mulatta]MOV95331.1 immunoglobulin light chain junction region [Macaca mulatta]MOV97174.1 immunoglobulin light chain junction region [Macaca mulatta]MOV97191.1 immunoglobulin light chain junction region [Macaca mulatta]MOV98109.1 immunoglobulin light chain junction region [Macaca mulatta]